MRRRFILVSAAACSLALLSLPAFAVGNDTKTPTCKKGSVWDAKKAKCVQAKAGVLPDDALADYAYALAKEGRAREALEVLALLKDPTTAKALNYRGYATRLDGRVNEGIALYKQAVSLDPDYTLVREYLGEAYVLIGDVTAARRELAEIEKRCGKSCEEYEDLLEAIERAEKKT
jgi:tetratricopeptide (TPR) repeat protein